MKITKKIVVAVIGFTWVALSSLWAYAATTTHNIKHHKHHTATTDFWTWRNIKLLPFNFESTTTQLSQVDLKKINNKWEKKWKKDNEEWSWENLEFHWWALWFLWNFLDDSQLSENQKVEISLLQANKQRKMAELHEKMVSYTWDKQGIALEMKSVNNEFLTALKKYIPDEKVAEYDEFLSELPDRDMKAEKKKWEHNVKKVEKGEKVAQK